MPGAMKKAKPPVEVVEFTIQMYALQQYKRWTDADLAKCLGVCEKTVAKMRNDPFSVSGELILRVQAMLKTAKENY